MLDVYAALPSITGKLELEYEGELKGGDAVARELIRLAVGKVFTGYFYDGEQSSTVVQWFELGGSLKLQESASSSEMVKELGRIQGLMEKVGLLGLGVSEPDAVRGRPPNSSSKACTRTGASAAMRRPDSRPSRGAASPWTIPRPGRPKGSISEVDPLLALHRRRFRPQRRRPDARARGLLPRERLSTIRTCSSASSISTRSKI